MRRAAAAGFQAVEVHHPFGHEASEIAALLDELNLTLVGLNVGFGAGGPAEFGVGARPGREDEAKQLIDQAISYGTATGVNYVHVLAGLAEGPAARNTFVANLTYACERAGDGELTVVIEPLSSGAAPGYFLRTVDQACSIIEAVGAPNLKLLFDCFHVESEQGDVATRLRSCAAYLGHVQIASVPGRSEPNTGDVDYRQISAVLDDIGYAGWVGAEYNPTSTVEAGLGWFKELT